MSISRSPHLIRTLGVGFRHSARHNRFGHATTLFEMNRQTISASLLLPRLTLAESNTIVRADLPRPYTVNERCHPLSQENADDHLASCVNSQHREHRTIAAYAQRIRSTPLRGLPPTTRISARWFAASAANLYPRSARKTGLSQYFPAPSATREEFGNLGLCSCLLAHNQRNRPSEAYRHTRVGSSPVASTFRR